MLNRHKPSLMGAQATRQSHVVRRHGSRPLVTWPVRLFAFKPQALGSFSLILAAAFQCVGVAGTIDDSQSDWYDHYKTQPNAPNPAEQLLNKTPEPKLTGDGFESLFNGRDLTGWTAKGGASLFEVRDGCIAGTCVPKAASTYLCTDDASFKDFLFTCEMRWQVDGNTGVQFRSRTRQGTKGRLVIFGPQAEMEGFEKKRGWSGGIYGQSCGGYFYPLWLKKHEAIRAALKQDEWNRLTILARDNTIKTWLNGVPAAHWVDDGTYPSGFFALQVHHGLKGAILWKDLRVRRLAAGEAP